MNTSKIKPPTYLLIALLSVAALHFFLPVMTLIPAPWTLLGILPIVLGIIANLDADQSFHRAKTTVSPFATPSALITSGFYRWTRNPMYLGFVLVLSGAAVMLGSLSPFIVIFVFGVAMDRLFIEMEETNLAIRFGLQWEEYKQRTRRWL